MFIYLSNFFSYMALSAIVIIEYENFLLMGSF